MTPEQWQKMKQNESADKAKKNFAAFGPISFKSRSLQSCQKELEQGKAGHLMPMMDAKEKLKAGKIRKEDIPYMQRGTSGRTIMEILESRFDTIFCGWVSLAASKKNIHIIGGSWDNSDVSTAKKIQWNDYDKQYENTEKKPFWAGTDWSGRNPRSGPAASAKKQQAPPKPQTKKLFGMW